MQNRTADLYLECASGISGDMFAAAMLDLGADRDALQRALDSLPVRGFRTEISTVFKAGIRCCDFNVRLDAEHENHDHDMEYLYGHLSGEYRHSLFDGHQHAHSDENQHGNCGGDPCGSQPPGHEHRTLKDVLEILNAADMTDSARMLAGRIFRILAEAEAKVHGTAPEQVQFHEVGAVDSIVDITAAAVCFDSLSVRRVFLAELQEGSGTVRCAHGILPVPVPAVAAIAEKYRLPVSVNLNRKGEFITPTGAAIAAAVCTDRGLPAALRIRRTGYGSGKRDYGEANFLRAMLLEPEREERDTVWKLETNVDDSTGEILGYAMERLFEEGALDVYYLPVFMKKNRPAWILTALCREERITALEDVIFRETTTIGIRRSRMERSVLEREEKTVRTPYGAARVKVCGCGDRTEFYPEYESAKEIARKGNLSFRKAYRLIRDAAEDDSE